jgi:maleylacetate reductase
MSAEGAVRLGFTRQDGVILNGRAADVVVDLAVQAQATRVVLVTSRSLADSALIGGLWSALGSRFGGLYGSVRPHSPREDVLAAAALAREAECDLLVAVGGGSVIDAAKVVQLCLWQRLATTADLDRVLSAASEESSQVPSMLAVPTTLSAAEFNALAGVTDTARGRKEAFTHPDLAPRWVVLDPAALAQTPAHIVVSTGVRAVDHCVEGFCSPLANGYHDALAVAGLQALSRHLPRVMSGDASISDFTALQTAAWMAISGPASGLPVGASHGIGRVLGSVCDVSHGHTSAVLLPAVLQWSAEEPGAKQRQDQLMRRSGLSGSNLPTAIRATFDGLRQPRRLSDLDVRREQFSKIAEYAMGMLRHPSASGNARAVRTIQDILDILEMAW